MDDDERLAAGYDLLQRFRRLIARRSARDLDQGLPQATYDALSPRAQRQFPLEDIGDDTDGRPDMEAAQFYAAE